MTEKRHDDASRDVEGREQIEGAPGTTRGRAGTAGSEGRRSLDSRPPRKGGGESRQADRTGMGPRQGGAGRHSERERDGGEPRHTDRERQSDATQQRADQRTTSDATRGGNAGEGEEESGSVPGSFGGTTGTAGHAGGIQSPGATQPTLRGIDPEEAHRKIQEGRKRRERE